MPINHNVSRSKLIVWAGCVFFAALVGQGCGGHSSPKGGVADAATASGVGGTGAGGVGSSSNGGSADVGAGGSTNGGAAGGNAGAASEPDGAVSNTDAQPSAGLRNNVAPGGNFDLSRWELQEPVGSPGAPTILGAGTLVGSRGFSDAYFFTDAVDGAMTFWAPENGVTTPNSNYPRSELRELNADGTEANWAVAGTNTLSATVAVVKVPDHVCVGQIHIGTAIQAGLAVSTKPLLELYYYANGDIKLGIERDPVAGGQTSNAITNVPLGTKFSYIIQLKGDGTIVLTLNGAASTFTMPSSCNGYGMYFKAGDYDQTFGSDPTVGATVKFYALTMSHGS